MNVYELMQTVPWNKNIALYKRVKNDFIFHSFGMAWEMQFYYEVEHYYQDTDNVMVVLAYD